MMLNQTNKEGLTWLEWARAATVYDDNVMSRFGDPNTIYIEFDKAMTAWRNGEDPTEWRKHMEERLSQVVVHLE